MAKKSLAVASYNHYKRVKWAKNSSQTTQPKAKLGENLFAGKVRNRQRYLASVIHVP
jgi:ATP-dependent protease Clp ATPase subunit